MTIACAAPQADSNSAPTALSRERAQNTQNENRSHLGHLVLQLLDTSQLSLNALAKRVGWNRGHLSRVFSGPADERRAPSANLVNAIAEQLGHRQELQAAARRDGHLPELPPTGRRPAQIPAPSQALVGHPLANVGRHTLVLDGPPGSGTSAWARWWADQIAGHYPDGTLHGEPRAHTPSQILAGWLTALGVETDRIPNAHSDRVRLWHALSRTRRLVVLLDGVLDPRTVRDLRPANSGSALIVTSRSRLTSLLGDSGAAHVSLGPLPAGEAREMLVEQLAPHQVSAEHDLLDAVAQACGRLPLALQLAAARLAACADPHAVLNDLQADPLAVLRTTHGDSLLRRYHEHLDALPTPHTRVAQLLARHDQPATATEIAALRPTTESDARRLADDLVAAHVLVTTDDGRYRMPDLLARALRARRGRRDQQDLDEPQRRWCAWWLVHARRAAALLDPGAETSSGSWQPPSGLASDDITTPEHARAWCAAHVDELPTVISRAGATGLPAWWYLHALRPYLAETPHPETARQAMRAARDASLRQTDQLIDRFDDDLAGLGTP